MPALGCDEDVGRSKLVEPAHDLVPGSLGEPERGHERGDADHGAERRQHGAPGTGQQARQALVEEVTQVETGPGCGERAWLRSDTHGRTLPSLELPASTPVRTPSTMRTRRCAREATCSSWVMTASVSPSLESWAKTSSTLSALRESRLPVGSSHRSRLGSPTS